MRLNNMELSEVNGGLSLSATLFSSISSLMSTIYEIGQSVGSAITRIATNNTCSI